jgi:hypothetical protein
MEIPVLKESGVVFNEQDHTYFLGEKQLQGITSTLVHRVYPHDYDNVSQEKLIERAEYGHKVHDMLEFCITNGLDSEMPEWTMFKQMVQERSYKIIRCEYIVTDYEHYASPIDVVLMREDGKIVLGDIKTNWKAPIEKGTVQLSWYKRRFEEMNPELEVAELAIFWVRDDAKRGLLSGYYPITPWADEPLEYLIECDQKDEDFDLNKLYGNLPAVFAEVEDEVGNIERMVKIMQEKQKTLRDGLYKLMEQYNVKSWTGSKVKLTRVLPSTTEKFDSKAFKTENPELYKKYCKKSETAGSLRVTLVE